MRSLPSVESSRIVNTSLAFKVTPVDQSTTFTFSNWHIQNLTPISYEINYLGGFGKSSTYQITLSHEAGLTFWKENYRKFVKAETALTVYANSDEFTPHIGIVQDITRFANDPGMIELQIFDKFFNNIPQYPASAIVDSYSDVHPEVSNNNWGYPSYYGKHVRPFYMTPVDCDLKALIGPINVSSTNHVSSLYFNRDKTLGISNVQSASQLILLDQSWAQQSGATNLSSGALPFEVHDSDRLYSHIWKFTESHNENRQGTQLSIDAEYESFIDGYLRAKYAHESGTTASRLLRPSLNSDSKLKILHTTKLNYSVITSDTVNPLDYIGTLILDITEVGTAETFFDITSNQAVGSVDLTGTAAYDAGQENYKFSFYFFHRKATAGILPTMQASISWGAQLKSENYANYSIFAAQVNCSDIAISENPLHILTDIYSQSTLSFRQSQASDTQAILENSGYAFQCYFGQRKKLTDISQNFAEITGTYIYVGDSGQINFRAYQESATASLDTVITPHDYQKGTLKIMDNPLGTTIYDTEKAKRIAIEYNYNFTTERYESSLVADANNTAACNSVSATGINNEISTATEYFLEADTASMYLSNLLRKKTKDEQIVQMTLPARFFGLELADVIKLQQPILEGSESLYQITKLKPDYLRGNVAITANKLINL